MIAGPLQAGCPHFAMIGCEKWKTGCHHCPQYKAYPKSYVDQSKLMFTLKKKWFTGLDDLTLVTPSQWLADLVKQSFLKAYPVRVIHNGIDLSVFKQITGNFKDKHLIPQGKHIVLGVSLSWSNRKGLDVFIELSRRLDSEKYQIVLVGIGKELAHGLPDNIISIDHTQNQAELC